MTALATYSQLIVIMENLPEIVRETRLGQGLTYRQVSALTGVSLNAVWSLENRHGRARGDIIVRMLYFVRDYGGGIPP